MITYLRYALTTFCFAASVGCLALWWRSEKYTDLVISPFAISPERNHTVTSKDGLLEFSHYLHEGQAAAWSIISLPIAEDAWTPDRSDDEWFGRRGGNFWFPLWYPALIFALAGVAALRVSRRFTLRSAIIATTVVAGLLGMAVGL